MGVDRCFADELDPLAGIKVSRGKLYPDNLIPHLDTATTTDRVKKLMPDLDGVTEIEEDFPVELGQNLLARTIVHDIFEP